MVQLLALIGGTGPAMALDINSAAAFTNTRDIVLTLNRPANCYAIQVQNENGTAVTISSPGPTQAWTLSEGDGLKTVTVTYQYTVIYEYACGSYVCGTYCCDYDWLGRCEHTCNTYCTAYCQGQSQQTTQETATITLDGTPPQLTLSTLADGSATNVAMISVNGTASDANGLSALTVNGNPLQTGTWGLYGTTVDLALGPNPITVVATDAAGNQTVQQRTIFYDNLPPALTVTTIKSPVHRSEQTLSGTMESGSSLTVQCPTATVGEVLVPGDGQWSVTLAGLAKGDNTVGVAATDPAGNQSTKTITLTYAVLAGDVNTDGQNDLADVILALQWMAGVPAAQPVDLDAEINGDQKMGLAEAVYLLQTLSDLRYLPPTVAAYEPDANTVLLDHFNGASSASILAFSQNGQACPMPLPSATPRYAYVAGPEGLSQALALDPPEGQPAGSASYLKYPGSQPLSQTNGTLEFWVYLTSWGTNGTSLVSQGPYFGACSGWTFSLSVSSTGQLQTGAWAAFSLNSADKTLPLNRWVHLAVTWGSAGAKLFIDGVVVGTDPNTGMPAGGYGGYLLLPLGTTTGAGARIDELRVSNIQRTGF